MNLTPGTPEANLNLLLEIVSRWNGRAEFTAPTITAVSVTNVSTLTSALASLLAAAEVNENAATKAVADARSAGTPGALPPSVPWGA